MVEYASFFTGIKKMDNIFQQEIGLRERENGRNFQALSESDARHRWFLSPPFHP